ncbi:MAG: ABC transporter permease subunit [Burkholderiales bacterium]|nr:ABC transporter permease subunit [Anaerolineae bacterium]
MGRVGMIEVDSAPNPQAVSETPRTEALPHIADTPLGVIFRRTLLDNMVSILSWGLGYSVLIVLVVVLYPSMQQQGTLLALLRGMGLLNTLTNEFNVEALVQLPGYLAVQAMNWAPHVMAVFVIPQAMAAISGEERRGTLDLLLSAPIPRWRLLTEKTLATVVSLFAILFIMWLSLFISTRLMPGAEMDTTRSIAVIWHVAPISLVMLMLTLFFSVLLRNSRTAAGVAVVIVISSYFLRAIADISKTDFLVFLKNFSIFNYYRSIAVGAEGFQVPQDAIMLTLALVLFVLALVAFQRRDIGV